MELKFATLRKRIRESPEDAFQAICAEVDTRRGVPEGQIEASAFVEKASEEVFEEICQAVIRRKAGATEGTIEDRVLKALAALSDRDLQAGIRNAMVKGDAAFLGRLMEITERRASSMDTGGLVVEIVPYTVPDPSLPEIVMRAPNAVYEKVAEAMLERARRKGLADYIAWLDKQKARAIHKQQEMMAQRARLKGPSAEGEYAL